MNGGYKPGFLWCRDGATKMIRCRDGVFYWRRDGAMKMIRCRDGVLYWRRDGAMKLIRCRDGVFYWRRDGVPKTKRPWGSVSSRGKHVLWGLALHCH